MLSAGSYDVLTGKSGWDCSWGSSEVAHGKTVEAAVLAATLEGVSFACWSM